MWNKETEGIPGIPVLIVSTILRYLHFTWVFSLHASSHLVLYDTYGFADSDYEYRIQIWKGKEIKRKQKAEAIFKRLTNESVINCNMLQYYNYLCFKYIRLIAFNFNFMQNL